MMVDDGWVSDWCKFLGFEFPLSVVEVLPSSLDDELGGEGDAATLDASTLKSSLKKDREVSRFHKSRKLHLTSFREWGDGWI